MAEEPTPEDKATDSEVTRIINLLMPMVREAAGEIDDKAMAWWTKEYRFMFFYALKMKLKKYADAEKELPSKARELGTTARRLAQNGPITMKIAAEASFEVDCKPLNPLLPPKLEEIWCN